MGLGTTLGRINAYWAGGGQRDLIIELLKRIEALEPKTTPVFTVAYHDDPVAETPIVAEAVSEVPSALPTVRRGRRSMEDAT